MLPSPRLPRRKPSSKRLPEIESKFLPHGLLFAPLHADPRWPHFSIAYRSISSGLGPTKTGSANFGETFALYRDAAPLNGQWEIAIQAGVFSTFNMDASSKDLVNADYTAGLLTTYRTGPFSGFLRIHHQSSHLGDEFILDSPTPVHRVNLSFEEIDLKLSYELFSWLRVYGGGGILMDRDPSTLGRGTSQFGLEFTSPRTFLRRENSSGGVWRFPDQRESELGSQPVLNGGASIRECAYRRPEGAVVGGVLQRSLAQRPIFYPTHRLDRTRLPFVLLIHPDFRSIVFVMSTSCANTQSVSRNILSTSMAQPVPAKTPMYGGIIRPRVGGKVRGGSGRWLPRRGASTAFHFLPE